MAELCMLALTIAIVWIGAAAIGRKQKPLHYLMFQRSLSHLGGLESEIRSIITSKHGELIDIRMHPIVEGDKTIMVVTVLYRS